MTIREAQDRISAIEFAEWMAYYQLEPWGEDRADLRAGIVSSTIANVHRGKNTRHYKPRDFMPDYEKESGPKQSGQQMAMMLKMFAKRHNKAIDAKEKAKSKKVS